MNFIFHLTGDQNLKASSGHVPEAFYEAVHNVTADDFVYAYDGGFVHSVAMHDRLFKQNKFSSYVIFRYPLATVTPITPELLALVVEQLKQTNFARPVESHVHYQVFSMEMLDLSFDDDD